MSIQVSVPLESLNNPNVAHAFSDLMLALGGVEDSSSRPAQKRSRSIAPVEPAHRKERYRRSRSVTSAAVDRPQPKKPRRGRKPRETTMTSKSGKVSYQAFFAGLPERTRAFLDLIQLRGTVTLKEVAEELRLDRPKALGGISGSLTRWAKQRGVELPYEAGNTASGERCWTWKK